MREIGITIDNSSKDNDKNRIQWADTKDHKKTFGLSTLGFWQWNVNLFLYIDSSQFNLKVPDTGIRKVQGDVTITVDLLDKDEKAISTAYATLKKKDSVSGKSPNEQKTFELVSSEIKFGYEQISSFNAVKGTIVTKTKELYSCIFIVRYFSPIPDKDTAELEYSTGYTVREVFHLGERRKEATKQGSSSNSTGSPATTGKTGV
jgi:hypothetical protein